MMRNWVTYAKNGGLLAFGFIAGILGISLHTGDSPKAVVLSTLHENTGLHISSENSCVEDKAQTEDKLFFLSCGGIF